MHRFRWLSLLMVLAMLVVTGFQVYWLRDNYLREEKALTIRVQGLFNETVQHMQDSIFRHGLRFLVNDSTASRPQPAASAPIGNRVQIHSRVANNPAAPPLPVLLTEKKGTDSSKRISYEGAAYISLAEENGTGKDSSRRSFIRFDSLLPGNIERIVVMSQKAQAGIVSAPDSVIRIVKKESIGSLARTATDRPDSQRIKRSVLPSAIYLQAGSDSRYMVRIDSLLKDSIPLSQLTATFDSVLLRQRVSVPFSIAREKADSINTGTELPVIPSLNNASRYKLQLGNVFPFLARKLSLPFIFSLLLVGITLLSFMLLYRSLAKQHRLTEIKNEFISNITHELKTPIATVGVAIEALRNFNAINDPQRTREYLDISRNELQRLSLLVDKVLKLSMFEKKEIEFRKEWLDLRDIAEEVASSMRLQLERAGASFSVSYAGNTQVEGDRLHLTSLVFNLLDNALKYATEKPEISLSVEEKDEGVQLRVADNGIGIPVEYRHRIFEKFFRVPHGDVHNAKGYGLGLSYAAQVVAKHNGIISVSGLPGEGTVFTIVFPKKEL